MIVNFKLENGKTVTLNLCPLINFLNAKSKSNPQKVGLDCLQITNMVLDGFAKHDPQLADDTLKCLHHIIGNADVIQEKQLD